ncbi:hypothetical protein EmuJ_001010300 [Echinococcus multilocularis]|uniref:Secreted protein n=1 Tax=Echinococcus multilocularis TaxID=6211 RepID=A0A068YGD7_ECHMU|nr:hypothetical protein EmuJ_001010300 [Echinococcus multilocularis]
MHLFDLYALIPAVLYCRVVFSTFCDRIGPSPAESGPDDQRRYDFTSCASSLCDLRCKSYVWSRSVF